MAEGSRSRGSAKVLLGKTIIGHAHDTGVSDDDGIHNGEVIVVVVDISQSTCLLEWQKAKGLVSWRLAVWRTPLALGSGAHIYVYVPFSP